MARKVLENKIEKKFKDYLDIHKVVNIKGNPHGLKGFPDRIVFADKIYFIEFKVGKENGSYYSQSRMQKYWEKTIVKSQGYYVLLEGMEEALKFAKELVQKKEEEI